MPFSKSKASMMLEVAVDTVIGVSAVIHGAVSLYRADAAPGRTISIVEIVAGFGFLALAYAALRLTKSLPPDKP